MDQAMLTDWLYEGKYEEPEAKVFDSCNLCDALIIKGDTYYEIYNRNICEDCIDSSREMALED